MGLWKHKLFVDPVKKSTCKVWHETKAKEKVVECEKVMEMTATNFTKLN